MARKPTKPRDPAPRPAASPTTRPNIAAALARVPWDAVTAAFCLLFLASIVTVGDWDFFPRGGFLETFYDGQAASLLHARIDVTPDAIGPEAFVRNGKTYGYFGPTPAFFRLPAQLLLPGMYGRWNCLSLLASAALLLGMVALLLRRLTPLLPNAPPALTQILRVALILAVTLGSTTVFVSGERKVYQEAILWGASLAFTHAVLLVCYLLNPKPRYLYLSCFAAFLAFFARVSSGSGPLFSLLLIDLALLLPIPRFREFFIPASLPRRAAAPITATLFIAALVWCGINYWKFGTAFVTQPVALNKQFNTERVQRVKGDIVSLYNLPITIPAYLSPSNIAFSGFFPWAYLALGDRSIAAQYPKAHFDGYEPYSSIPAAMPELLLAALAGFVLCFRRANPFRDFRAPLLGALAGCPLMFVFGSVTYRYTHDALPFLALAAAIALAAVAAAPRRRLRFGLTAAFLALTVYAIWVNLAFTTLWQRFSAYPIPPAKRVAFSDFRAAVDNEGLSGALSFVTHWHRYIPAASFQQGNLLIDNFRLAERGDQPVVRSQGQPPFSAGYTIDVPSAGVYSLDIRYAAALPQAVHLLLNGQTVRDVCTASTGGWLPQNQLWTQAGAFRLNPGPLKIGLASTGPVPPISMLRMVRIE